MESIEREFAIGWAGRLGASGSPDADLKVREPGHTCHWLYKTMVMDAGGRVLPCCSAPTPQRDLVFSEQGDHLPVDHYNSPKYNSARSYFADPEGYRRAAPSGEAQPHCVNCEWNQTETNFNNRHLQNYFAGAEFNALHRNHENGGSSPGRSVPPEARIFDPASLELLCNW